MPQSAQVLHHPSTNNLLVANNTCFQVYGSGYYIEDGAEERNNITGNFAGYVHPLGRVDTCRSNGSVFDAPLVYQVIACCGTDVRCV